METQGDRLNLFIRSLGISNKEFAERVGVAPNYISMLIKNRVNLSDKFIYKLTKVFDHLNVHWLESGEEPMNLPKQLKPVADQSATSGHDFHEFYQLLETLQSNSGVEDEIINDLRALFEKLLKEKDSYQKKYIKNLERLNQLQDEIYKLISISKKP